MGERAYSRRTTEAEYLEGETQGTLRHEFVAGHTFPLITSAEHDRLAADMFGMLLAAAPRGYSAYAADIKIRVEAVNAFYYPDVVVAANSSEDPAIYLTTACVITEVLSPSTESTDRREKLMGYRTLPDLKDYLLVSPEGVAIEHYAKRDGSWERQVLGPGDVLELVAFPTAFDLERIYGGGSVVY